MGMSVTRPLAVLAVVAMALIVTLPAVAQEAGPMNILPGGPTSAPRSSTAQSSTAQSGAAQSSASQPGAPKDNPDEPPPLNLGGDTRPDPVANASKETRAVWNGYARTMHRALDAALTANPKTRNGPFRAGFELWVDAKGRVMRVRLVSSSGNPAMDAALRDELMPGLALPVPPPDLPMPVIVNLGQ